jgi:histone-lysine N-methyltransferase SETD2
MTTWPLLNRNKVEDSRVIVPVQACVEQDNLAVKELAQKASLYVKYFLVTSDSLWSLTQLIAHWDTLPTYNRIPKRVKQVQSPSSPNILFIYPLNARTTRKSFL